MVGPMSTTALGFSGNPENPGAPAKTQKQDASSQRVRVRGAVVGGNDFRQYQKLNPATGQWEEITKEQYEGILAAQKANADAEAMGNQQPINPLGVPEWYQQRLSDLKAQNVGTQNFDAARQTQAQGREAELDALRLLRDQALGNNSVAQQEANLQRGQIQNAIRSQLASVRGGYDPAAFRSALMQSSQLQQNMAGEAELNRLRELDASRKAFVAGTQGLRQGDLSQMGVEQQEVGNLRDFLVKKNIAEQGWAETGLKDKLGVLNALMGKYQTDSGAAQGDANREANQNAANTAFYTNLAGGLVKGLGDAATAGYMGQGGGLPKPQTSGSGSTGSRTAPTSVASDENVKKNVSPASGEIGEFLKSLSAKEFEYKDQQYGQGRRIGVMAQDLEKTKLGASMVSRDSDGVRHIDLDKALPVLFAAMGELHKQAKR